jgi:hypothetical protein
MTQDRFTDGLGPEIPSHLVGEIADLRNDMEEAFSRVAAEIDGGGIIIRTAETAGDSPTVLYAYNVPEKSLTSLNVVVTCKGGNDYGQFHRLITVNREESNAEQIGPTMIPYPDRESDGSMDVSLTVSGSVVLLMVKGLPSKTIFWSCRIEITGAVED